MADQRITLNALETFIHGLTCSTLGIPLVDNADPENPVPINQGAVRKSWPASGAPAWGIDVDVVFFSVNTEEDDYCRQRNRETLAQPPVNGQPTGNLTYAVSYIRRHKVYWILYGPNSFDRGETLRNGIYLPAAQELIRAQHMSLIPDFTQVRRFPELFNGQWWQRADWQASFYELVVSASDIPYLTSADIVLVTEENEVKIL